MVNYKKNTSNLPTSNLLGFISIPIILDAPFALHPIATARPIAPRPQIPQTDPDSTYKIKTNLICFKF